MAGLEQETGGGILGELGVPSGAEVLDEGLGREEVGLLDDEGEAALGEASWGTFDGYDRGVATEVCLHCGHAGQGTELGK